MHTWFSRVVTMASLLLLSACGTIGKAPDRAPTKTERFSDGGSGGTKHAPYPACGPRDSYRFIAETFVCPDGQNPFDGDAQSAARSRVGNVGTHLSTMPTDYSESHIVDVYRVPCATGPVDVYVCMYHCAR